jgi:hypothetical protein
MVEMDYSVAYFKMLLVFGSTIVFLLFIKEKITFKKGKFKDKEYLVVTDEWIFSG